MMKKLFSMLLILSMSLALFACGGTPDKGDGETSSSGTEGETLPPGIEEETVGAGDVADILDDLISGDALNSNDTELSDALDQLPDTFEELLETLELDSQKNAYLAEIEGFLASLEGEITRISANVNGEAFAFTESMGADFLYAGVKDGAILFTMTTPVELNGNKQDIVTNVYMTIDPATKTAHAVTEASGIIVDHQEIPYGAMLDAYLDPDSEMLFEIGMMYDMYVAEIKAMLAESENGAEGAFTLPEIAEGDLTSQGNNKFTLNNSYFIKLIKALAGDDAMTQAQMDQMIEMLSLNASLTFELYNKTTVKSVSITFSADLAPYFYNITDGSRKVDVDFSFSMNYEGDQQLSATLDVTDMLKLDASVVLDVTKKDGKIVKGTQETTLSLTTENLSIFGSPDEDDFILDGNNVATAVGGGSNLLLKMTQDFDLTACEKKNATVYSMTYELDAEADGMQTTTKQELSLKTTEVGKYTLTEKIDADQGGEKQKVEFTLDFAVGTAEGFNVPQVILDAIAAE